MSEDEHNLIREISFKCDILYDTARILYSRGIDTPEKAKVFLSPSKREFNNPFAFKEMQNAIDRIALAKTRKENVLIYGDYDADGVCAVAILKQAFSVYGIDAFTVLPEREEGYGLHIETAKRVCSDIDLIVTVDCGISDRDIIEELKAQGTDVIVTDHHEPPEILPNTIKINPKISDSGYPFSGLCGAGVAYKLAYALIGDKADETLDFVALATVADSMELVGENRSLVAEGLKLFAPNKIRKAFSILMGDNNGKPVTAQTLAFSLAPKINAGGRMGDAQSALKMLVSNDVVEMTTLGEALKNYNQQRQIACDDIYRQAKEKIHAENLTEDSVIVVAEQTWKTGVVGIVASKLVEDYNRPVIVFAGHDQDLKGSARSVDGVNVFDCLTAVKEHLVGFGGHSGAAGVTINPQKLCELRRALNDYFDSAKFDKNREKEIFVEWETENPVSYRFARELELLEPFGIGNRRPYFSVCVGKTSSRPLKLSSPHYTFSTPVIEMLDFNGECNVEVLQNPAKKNIVFELNASVFRGVESVKGFVKGVYLDKNKLSDIDLYLVENELKKCAYSTERPRVLPLLKKALCSAEGEVYLISDYKNANRYPDLARANFHLFTAGEKGNLDVIISPREIPAWAEKVIYLDVPLTYLDSDKKSFCKFDYAGYKFVDNLSIAREDFTPCFTKILSLLGREFTCATDFYIKNARESTDTIEKASQFVFAMLVFMELGFFKVEQGLLRRDARVQRPLTESEIYSRVFQLKE